MAKVLDVQEGEVITSPANGVFDIIFPHPFSEAYVIEIYSLDTCIFLGCIERNNLHWWGQAWHGNVAVNIPNYNHTHSITLSTCAAGHANCVASSPTGGPSSNITANTNEPLYNSTLHWIAIGF